MPAGRISQTIAPIIGSMSTGSESARALEACARFGSSDELPKPETDNPSAPLRLSAPHQLQRVDPGIAGLSLPRFLNRTEVVVAPGRLPTADRAPLPRLEHEPRDTLSVPFLRLSGPGEPPILFPAQIATLTWQQFRLNDNGSRTRGERPAIFGPCQAAEVFAGRNNRHGSAAARYGGAARLRSGVAFGQRQPQPDPQRQGAR